MKKLLLASVISLAPFAAFAHTDADTFAGASVSSQQMNGAGSFGGGSAGVVTGNYTTVNSNASAGPGNKVNANSTQLNIGGTVVGSSGHAGAIGSNTSGANGWAKATIH